MRTYGLSGSGMDVDQLVKDLMKTRRARYDIMYQKKTQAEWKKADFNNIYTKLSEFQRGTLFNNKMQATTMPKHAVSSNESVVSATALSDSASMSHSVQVDQLADGVKKASTQAITPPGNDKTSLQTQFGLGVGSFSITLKNGSLSKEITVDAGQSIYSLVASINASGTNIRASYDSTLDRFFLNTTNTGSTASIDFTGSSADGIGFLKNSLKINTGAIVKGSNASITTGTGTASLVQQFGIAADAFNLTIRNAGASAVIAVDPTQSITTLVNSINSAGINVSASYDSNTDRFILRTTNEGSAAGIDFTGTADTGIAFLQSNLKLNTNALAQNGTDAIFDLDGVKNFSQVSNSFSISGVNYNLKSTGSANVVVSPNTEQVITNVKAFVESYNTMLNQVATELYEDRYSTFTPLTDDQKADMKETEITAWEAKAKSGMLRSDPTLRNVLDSLRSDLYSKVEGLTGKYKSASDIGITTGAYYDADGHGKIYLDETKLRTALDADPDIVNKIFASNGDDSAHDGIAVRLYDTVEKLLTKIVNQAGVTAGTSGDTKSLLAKSIAQYTKNMSNMETQLATIQDRYYKQFDAMEKALQKMNQQSSWLSQQFSSGGQ